MKQRVFCKTHSPVSPVQAIKLFEWQVQLIFDVRIEVVRVIADYIFHDVNAFCFLQISNDRQRPADHVESSLWSVTPGDVLSFFFGAISKFRLPIAAEYEHFGSADCALVDEDIRSEVHLVIKSSIEL